ncbi:protein serine/threonine phosphatase 2C [Multifurca ochricompacta]|uniref:Protein serine/threonine phosphatase 2C n=1 Tax=Multifurca ochricompacta TaxID=376703 RepID=A0AAD4MAT3_9AGAM|nr:protein serine/threonine phosphatase 2C [Multifurca ochricompacta]
MISCRKTTPWYGVRSVKLPYVATTPNFWSSNQPTFRFGVLDEKGPRRTMEDAHSYVFDYAGVHGQGFFAVFDGHAGKEAADWCGKNFHEYLLLALQDNPEATVPDVYNQTFHKVDKSLSKISEDSQGKIHSGCTAVTAFLRIEDADGRQSFLKDVHDVESDDSKSANGEATDDQSKKSNQSRLKKALKQFSQSSRSPSSTPRSLSPSTGSLERVSQSRTGPPLRRVLYVANAGDARGVLCRNGRALRLTYDHKGTDKQEAKRIMDSGGFVMSGRVNGVLAVTRSLGDSSMKEFVVGAPYTTETLLTEDDELLILACDGIWDVLDDQAACELVRAISDPQEAAKTLVQEATHRYTNDNITVMVIRLKDVPYELKAAVRA